MLGFYHPYCRLFRLQRCDSFSYYELGAPDSALWANLPDRLSSALGRAGLMENITRASLALMPEYLARDDSLTFVHLNLPHLPAEFAAKVLHLPPTSNVLTQYSRNLQVADQVLGDVVRASMRQSRDCDLLLVVSTDHWFRKIWYQADEPEVVQRVPFIVWRVGETQGLTVSEPLSTVHTANMILDYLDGKLDTQAEIAEWWSRQTIEPTFIVPRR